MSGQGLTVLLLAAGGSSRLGRPKQLVHIGADSLLRHAAREAVAAGVGPVLVVLGAFAETIEPELDGLEVEVLVHPEWKQGMGSSIAAGLEHLLSGSQPPARVLLTLCDQPGITRGVLRALRELHEVSDTDATACVADGIARAPAIFGAGLFPELLALRADLGAREILRDPGRRVALLPCPPAASDIDTEDDVRAARRAAADDDLA